MTLHLYPGRKNLDEVWRFKVTEPSYVYVLKAEGDRPIKVGYAANAITRLAELQTGNPRPLELMYVIPGDRELEWQLHGIAEKMLTRLVGEWFSGPDYSEFLEFVGGLEDRMLKAADVGQPFGWRHHYPEERLFPRPVRVRRNDPTVTVLHTAPNPLSEQEQAERERQRQMAMRTRSRTADEDENWYPGKEDAA